MALTNDDNYKILIQSTADDKGAKDMHSALQKLSGQTSNTGAGFLKMSGAVAAGQVAFSLLKSGAGMAIDFLKDSVKSANDSENSITQLNAVLASTKGASGMFIKDLTDQASALQKMTTFSDEAIASAQGLLLTFTNVKGKVFKDAIPVILDMSQALGQDLKSSSIQVGKALNDPIKGITALSRVGVSFTETQKDAITSLVNTGKTAEAQRLILKELNTEFGGSATAAGKTFAGSMERLKNQIDDVKESIGQTIVDGLTPLAGNLANFVASDQFKAWLAEVNKWMATNIPIAINWLKDTGLPLLMEAFNMLWPVVKTLAGLFIDLVTFMIDHQWVFWSLVGVLGAVKTALLIQSAFAAFQAGMATATASFGVLKALVMTPMVMPALGVAAALASVWAVYEAIQSVRGALDALNNTNKAVASNIKSNDAVIKQLKDLQANGTPEQKARAKSTLAKLASTGAFAQGGYTGAGATNEVAGIVHKGEYVLPKSQVNQSTGLPKAVGGNTTNITYNINGVNVAGDHSFENYISSLDQDTLLVSKGLSPKRGMS